MANLVESSVWEAGVYQIEVTDYVQGGAGGISNVQAQQLVNRTKWLKDQTSGMGSGTAAAPGWAFRDDTNTGLFRPGEDILAFSVGGVERARFQGGVFAVGSTVIAGANAGDIVLQQQRSIRGVNAEGTSTAPMLWRNGSNGTTIQCNGTHLALHTPSFAVAAGALAKYLNIFVVETGESFKIPIYGV